jgi:uncharacterized protein (DUF433 family)
LIAQNANPAYSLAMATTNLTDRITINPAVCSGKPTIRGMRIRVIDVLEMLRDGMSEADILEEFPELEIADIRASLDFAADSVDHKILKVV